MFIHQSLNLYHYFANQTRFIIEQNSIAAKMKARPQLSFEQFATEHYLANKMEYLTNSQIQRLITVKMVVDLDEASIHLMCGHAIDTHDMKILYEKYKTDNQILQLWFLWVQLKNKQIRQKPYSRMIYFYENHIQVLLQKLQPSLLTIRFQIYYSYQLILAHRLQAGVQQMISLKDTFYQIMNLKAFIMEMQLLKLENTTVILPKKFIMHLSFFKTYPKEDFLQLMYYTAKMLYPISESVAPPLAESIFNESKIMLLISKEYYKMTPQIQEKYDKLEKMFNKYHETLGKNLFELRTFKIQIASHKPTRSLQLLLNPTIQEPIQSHLESYKSSIHSKGRSVRSKASTRGGSQLCSPEPASHKEMWIEIDNFQLKQRKLVERPSVGMIYKKLIQTGIIIKPPPQIKEPTPTQSSIRDFVATPQHTDRSSRQPVLYIKKSEYEEQLKQQEEQARLYKEQQEKQFQEQQNRRRANQLPTKKIRFLTVVVALNMQYYHISVPGSCKLAKLVAKYFLDIMNYHDIPPYVKQTAMINRRRDKTLKRTTSSTNKPVFSAKVRRIINKIRTLMALGMFKRKKLLRIQNLGRVTAKPHSIQNFLDVCRRLKTVASESDENKMNRVFQTEPNRKIPSESSFKIKNNVTFGFFKAISIAKRFSLAAFVTKQEVQYLQEKYGSLDKQKQQHLYYPVIKYSLDKEFWKLKYKDLTNDKQFMIIQATNEHGGYYRFDLPMVADAISSGISIWPNVMKSLMYFENVKKYSQVFQFDKPCQNVKMKSFLVGLTQRARIKIQQSDLEAAAFVQNYLQNFHASQIVQTKKLWISYEILPIIQQSKFIDLVRINQVVRETNALYQLNHSSTSLYHCIKPYDIQNESSYLNLVLMFRFLCLSPRFMIEGRLVNNLKDLKVPIHQFLSQQLIILSIIIIKDVNFDITPLLKDNIQITKNPQIYGDKSYFAFCIQNQNLKDNSKGTPFIISIQLYNRLLSNFSVTRNAQKQIEFDELIENIIFNRSLTNYHKQLLNEFLTKMFEIKDDSIALQNDYSHYNEKRVSIKLLQQTERPLIYAISPMETRLKREQSLENLQAYHGRQTIEEPDFMNNLQEVQIAEKLIKQVKVYKINKNGLSKQVNALKFPCIKQKILRPQSYYVNCQLPPAIKLKTMILNRNPDLRNFFNCNSYKLNFNRSIQVDIYFYYSFNRKLNCEADQKSNERIYYADGESIFMNLQINHSLSKMESVKVILTQYDLLDLFNIRLPPYDTFYAFNDKFILDAAKLILQNTYAEKNFIYSLPTFLNKQFLKHKSVFMQYKRSIQVSSDSPRHSPKVANSFQFGNPQLLERHNNNKFVVLFDDAKEQACKNYCETHLKELRVIGHFVKVLNIQQADGQIISFKYGPKEYVIITVYCHLIIDCWIIQLYCPKTSRSLQATLNILDLASLDNTALSTILKDIYSINKQRTQGLTRQNTQNLLVLQKQQTFHNITKLFKFTRKMSNNLNKKLIQQRMFSPVEDFQEYHIWEYLVDSLKLKIKDKFNIRLESENQNKKFVEKNLIQQLEQITNAYQKDYKVIGEYIMQKKKNEEDNADQMLTHFRMICQSYLNFLKENTVLMVKSQQQTSSKISISNFESNMKEFIHKMQVTMDKDMFCISFYLDHAADTHLDNPFQSFDSINYANSSSYNLDIQIFSFQNDIQFSRRSVNVREVLNLFIADGYFKYQTNYMNAKLSLSDLKQICEYVGFKIKTSNFLSLAGQQQYVNGHPLFLEEQETNNQVQDGLVYTECRNKKLIQIQLFTQSSKVHVNIIFPKFKQIKLYFHQVDDICPQFSSLVLAGLPYNALRRLMKTQLN